MLDLLLHLLFLNLVYLQQPFALSLGQVRRLLQLLGMLVVQLLPMLHYLGYGNRDILLGLVCVLLPLPRVHSTTEILVIVVARRCLLPPALGAFLLVLFLLLDLVLLICVIVVEVGLSPSWRLGLEYERGL